MMDKIKIELMLLRAFGRRIIQRAWMFVAWRLPKQLVMWTTMRLIAYATQGKYGNTIVPELSAMDAVKRWEEY